MIKVKFLFPGFLMSLVLVFPFQNTKADSIDPTKDIKEVVSNLQSCNVVLSQDLADMAKKVNFASFLGKTVKIPIPSGGVSKIPGGDTDFLYITPPKYFKNTKTGKGFWYPLTSVFFADGKTISKDKENIVKSQVEKEIATAFQGKRYMLDQLKDIVISQMGIKNSKPKLQSNAGKSLWDFLLNQAKAADNNSIDGTIITNDNSITSNTNINASDLATQLGLTGSGSTISNSNINASDLATQLGLANGADPTQMFDMNDPRTQQLFMLLLMNFVLSQKAAEATGLDKTTCVNSGGEWINGTCVTANGTDNCDAGQIDFGSAGVGDGSCHDAIELKSTCQAGGGTWYQKNLNSNDNQSDQGSAFCKSQNTMTYSVSMTDLNSNTNSGISKVYRCVCPDGSCGDPTGKCVTADQAAGDNDNDNVPNGKDKCVSTASGESVNMDETSSDFGCSCTDLKKKGRLQAVACPPSQCQGQYWIQYPTQVDPNSLCSDGFIQSNPSTLCTPTQTMTQQCIDLDKQNQNQNQNQNSDIMKQLQDMMNQMNKGGGSSGGGSGSCGGGGGGGQQQPSNQGSPGSPSSQEKPSTTGTPAYTETKNPDGTITAKWADGSQNVFDPKTGGNVFTDPNGKTYVNGSPSGYDPTAPSSSYGNNGTGGYTDSSGATHTISNTGQESISGTAPSGYDPTASPSNASPDATIKPLSSTQEDAGGVGLQGAVADRSDTTGIPGAKQIDPTTDAENKNFWDGVDKGINVSGDTPGAYKEGITPPTTGDVPTTATPPGGSDNPATSGDSNPLQSSVSTGENGNWNWNGGDIGSMSGSEAQSFLDSMQASGISLDQALGMLEDASGFDPEKYGQQPDPESAKETPNQDSTATQSAGGSGGE